MIFLANDLMPLAIQTAVGSKRTEKKKIRIPDEICFSPPPPPPIISNASPSLKVSDIVTGHGLTMGSTTFEEVGVW